MDLLDKGYEITKDDKINEKREGNGIWINLVNDGHGDITYTGQWKDDMPNGDVEPYIFRLNYTNGIPKVIGEPFKDHDVNTQYIIGYTETMINSFAIRDPKEVCGIHRFLEK